MMLFNILVLNAQSCVRGVTILMTAAGIITCSLFAAKPIKASYTCVHASRGYQDLVDPQELLNRAELFKSTRQFRLALPLLDRYLALVPSNAEAYADKAYCLNGLHDFHSALTSADKGIACDSQNINLLSNKAWALNHLGSYKDALQTAKNALNLDPGDAESWCAEGEALMGLGDYNSALVAFNKHCGLHPTEWYAYDRRAQCYEKLGLKDAANRDHKAAESCL